MKFKQPLQLENNKSTLLTDVPFLGFFKPLLYSVFPGKLVACCRPKSGIVSGRAWFFHRRPPPFQGKFSTRERVVAGSGKRLSYAFKH